MFSFVFAFFTGVFVLQFWTVLPSLVCFISIFLPTFLFGIFFSHQIISAAWRFVPRFAVFLILGIVWAYGYAEWMSRWELPSNLEGKKIIVTGHVASLPKVSDQDVTFMFNAKTIAGSPQHARLHLDWYDKTVQPHLNEQWQLCVKLKRPHGMMNPGSFDFEQYLWQHGVRATGYVFACSENHFLDDGRDGAAGLVAHLRQQLKDFIAHALLAKPLAGMIIALVVGDQSEISKEQWQVFRDTGTSYLMAIAGLHISLFAGIMFMVARFLWRRVARLVLAVPAQQAAAVIALLGGLLYSVVSGFSIPTQRAFVMLVAVMGALLLRRNVAPLHTLLLALLVVLLFDPLAVLSVGFWLSFSAVVFIFYVSGARLRFNQDWFRKYWKMQWAITLGLTPFTLLFFQQVSFSTLVANIIAMPAVCSVVVPLSLLGSLLHFGAPRFGGAILWVAEKLLELVWRWLQWLASFSQFNWHHAIFHWWILMATLVGVLALLVPRGVPARIMGVAWLLPLIFYAPPGPKHGEIWFDLLDVGQGLAAVVRTQRHVLVYDAGPKFSDTDAGEAIVVPFLRASGVIAVDEMVISHGDEDHFGGAFSILKALPVKNVSTSVPEKFAGIKEVQHCYAGQIWSWDGVRFSFMHPPSVVEEGGQVFLGNNASCVLRIEVENGGGKSGEGNSLLLTGDVEEAGEKEMLKTVGSSAANKVTVTAVKQNDARHGESVSGATSKNKNTSENQGESTNKNDSLQATILVAPHHGSATAALPAFVAAVTPQYVLFPVGYLNRFHFPVDAVVNLYRSAGAKILTTAESGAIEFKLGNSKLSNDEANGDSNGNGGEHGGNSIVNGGDGDFLFQPQLYRVAHRRYWER